MTRPVKVKDSSDKFTLDATFLAFGIDCEVNIDGQPCHYSVAIIELPDGTVRSVSLNQIKFDDTE